MDNVGESKQRKLSLPSIPLSEEQRRILEQPVDPRVARILNELHRHRKALEELYANRRILRFPLGDDIGHEEKLTGMYGNIATTPPAEAIV